MIEADRWLEARAEIKARLESLRTDHVDLWQLHYLNDERDLPRILAPGGALEAALKAKEEGLTRFIGVTAYPIEVLRTAIERVEFDTIMSHNLAGAGFEPATFGL